MFLYARCYNEQAIQLVDTNVVSTHFINTGDLPSFSASIAFSTVVSI